MEKIITSLVRTPRKYLSLTFPDVQQQQGGSDCGLYALAFSFSLCSGTDRAKLVYHQHDMSLGHIISVV